MVGFKTMVFLACFASYSAFGTPRSSVASSAKRETPNIEFIFQLMPTTPVVGDKIRMRMLVENDDDRDGTTARMVHLRYLMLERYFGSWGGWKIEVEGPGGRYYMTPALNPAPMIRKEDIINLGPGESFGVIFEVGSYFMADKPYTRLNDTPGTFVISIKYEVKEEERMGVIGGYEDGIFEGLFRGPVSSPPMKFEIREQTHQ